jgi:multidrug efflux pump subunit AcrA (membrane-fusion protein)
LRFRVIYLALFLAALVAFPAGHAAAGPAGAKRRKRPPPIVSLEKVIRRSIRNQLSVFGTVEPYRTSIVSSEIEGQVKFAPLREGDPVVAGKTIIAELRRTDLDLGRRVIAAVLAKAEQEYFRLKNGTRPEEIDAFRARFKEKEAELQRDELEFKRTEDLFKRQILDRATLDRAVAKYQMSKNKYLEEKSNLRLAEIGPRREEVSIAAAELEKVRAEIVRLKDLISKTVIRSPLTGFLTEKTIEVGQWVAKGGKIGEVIETRKVIVRAPISEKQISFVKVGDAARVQLDAVPGRTFIGLIARIIPKADKKSRTFPVEVELDNTPENTIKAGMFARVSMEYGEPVEAVLIPKDALLIRPRGGAAFVFEKGKVREVTFRPGRTVDSLVEVPGDRLKPGMRVVVQGNEKLRTGMRVRLPGQRGRPGGKKGKGGRPPGKAARSKGRSG